MNDYLDELKKKIDSRLINGSDLAYLGDAYYELWMRTYFLSLGITKPSELNKKVRVCVSSTTHAYIVDKIIDKITDEERDVYTRGRNYHYRHKAKNASVSDYIKSSGLEAIIGYLYLNNKTERLSELMNQIMEILKGILQ
ncbi:MAG: Mini-ribonuclease 3 [Bacilli bacterium]|nr:Mini-ribonuclease 3 [Bacilli bacterium]